MIQKICPLSNKNALSCHCSYMLWSFLIDQSTAAVDWQAYTPLVVPPHKHTNRAPFWENKMESSTFKRNAYQNLKNANSFFLIVVLTQFCLIDKKTQLEIYLFWGGVGIIGWFIIISCTLVLESFTPTTEITIDVFFCPSRLGL